MLRTCAVSLLILAFSFAQAAPISSSSSVCDAAPSPEMRACLDILNRVERRLGTADARVAVNVISPEGACRLCASSGSGLIAAPPVLAGTTAPGSRLAPIAAPPVLAGTTAPGSRLAPVAGSPSAGADLIDGLIPAPSGRLPQGSVLPEFARSYPVPGSSSPSASAGRESTSLANGRWDSSIPSGTPADADVLRDWNVMSIPTPKDCPTSPETALDYPVRLGYINIYIDQSIAVKIRKPRGMSRVSDWYWTIPKDDRAFVAKNGRFVDGGDAIYLSLTSRSLYNKPNVFQIFIVNRKTGKLLDGAGIIATTSASGACRNQDARLQMCRTTPPNNAPPDPDPVATYDPRRSQDPVRIFDNGGGVRTPDCYFWTHPQASTSARDCFYEKEYCTLPWAPTGLYWPSDWSALALTIMGEDLCGRTWVDQFPAR